ncbi:molybdate ABC transporter substrate-binding protein [Halobacillus sp. A5]|uniref:molybdate ABC transporter substrate-binding protein n=1 Tax=Halobacillus sp. A5 TaxID=2880263 RepID=UPI0020A6440C|nr:molybdate ABC transporter substrate-binding protein [Halobacillus sp. A5]MCP3026883.1 molybdate ABC transporter substrate-binding protein [Halobacillus sp. A5]
MYTKIIGVCFIALLVLTGCSQEDEKTEITISAAASMKDALDEIIEEYENDHDVSITLNSGSSGRLAQQIQQGAPVDLIISANEQWTRRLADGQHIQSETETTIADNSLVLIAHADKESLIDELEQLTTEEDTDIVMGDPESAPAGNYAKQSLQHIGIWDDISEQLIYSNDVRQALTYVESQNADYGLVYASDALISDQVQVIEEIDSTTHDPIVYPAAITGQSSNQDTAEDFLNYLKTERSQEIFKSYGFS